ncbi:MAG: 3-deoxy-8-phosphooctulonate synthase, partial [Chryseotalea sp.]
MEIFKEKVNVTDTITLGGDKMVLFAGPCAAESIEICSKVAEKVKGICQRLDIQYVFKSSFDKANRTSAGSYRGPTMEGGIQILERIK